MLPLLFLKSMLHYLTPLSEIYVRSLIHMQREPLGTICAPIYAKICLSSKRDASILSLKANPVAICALSTIFLWYGPNQRTNKLKSCINEINKHSIKFDFQIPKEEIEFSDTLVYQDHNNHLQAILYKKPTDRQNYLHAKSSHLLSLKKSVPCIEN